MISRDVFGEMVSVDNSVEEEDRDCGDTVFEERDCGDSDCRDTDVFGEMVSVDKDCGDISVETKTKC